MPSVFQGSQKDRSGFQRNSSRLLIFLLDFEQGIDDQRWDLVTASNSSFHGVSLANLPTPGVETQSPKAPHRHKCPWKANCWGIPAQLRHLPTHREEAEWTPLRKWECSEYATITQTAAAVIAQWMFPFLRGCHVYQTILSLNYKTKNNMILLLYVFLHSLICSGVLNTQVLVRNRCLSFSILL